MYWLLTTAQRPRGKEDKGKDVISYWRIPFSFKAQPSQILAITIDSEILKIIMTGLHHCMDSEDARYVDHLI